MAKVTMSDVIDADQRVQEVLDQMNKVAEDEVYLATKAVCAAIQAFGVRLDYVLNTVVRVS